MFKSFFSGLLLIQLVSAILETPTTEIIRTKVSSGYKVAKEFLESDESGINIIDLDVVAIEKLSVTETQYEYLIKSLSERYGLSKGGLAPIERLMTRARGYPLDDIQQDDATVMDGEKASYCKVAVQRIGETYDFALACYKADFQTVCWKRMPTCKEACERQYKLRTSYAKKCIEVCENGYTSMRYCPTRYECGGFHCAGKCYDREINMDKVTECKTRGRNWENAARKYVQGRAIAEFKDKYDQPWQP